MRPSRAGCRRSRSGSGRNNTSLWGLEKVVGGWGMRLSNIVKMLQITSSENPIFICIDALGESFAEYWVKLNSLN